MSYRGLARHAAKRDSNEPAIVDALQRCGFVVKRISAKGAPDLLLSRRGHIYLAEVKAPKGTYTVDQVKWLRDWTGPIPMVFRTVQDAVTWAQQQG